MKKLEHKELSEILKELRDSLPTLFLNSRGQFCKEQGNGIVVVDNSVVLHSLNPTRDSAEKLAQFLSTNKPKLNSN